MWQVHRSPAMGNILAHALNLGSFLTGGTGESELLPLEDSCGASSAGSASPKTPSDAEFLTCAHLQAFHLSCSSASSDCTVLSAAPGLCGLPCGVSREPALRRPLAKFDVQPLLPSGASLWPFSASRRLRRRMDVQGATEVFCPSTANLVCMALPPVNSASASSELPVLELESEGESSPTPSLASSSSDAPELSILSSSGESPPQFA
mmetsp:Transcript_124749/g.216122  ORF Transcript_124749/g.216122 Transcript_124749/m.216122 type:complete len:207 (+) Transcript_124749:141-761(+)